MGSAGHLAQINFIEALHILSFQTLMGADVQAYAKQLHFMNFKPSWASLVI
jgi:hypothetical protein